MKRILLSILLISTLLLSGCGSSMLEETMNDVNSLGGDMNYSTNKTDSIINVGASSDKSSYSEDTYYEESTFEESSTNKDSKATSNAKLIRTVDLDLETREFDNLVTSIKEKTSDCGGYIEYSQLYNYSNYRSQDITVRIPYENVDKFLEGIDNYGSIKNISDRTTDITLEYANLEVHIQNLEAQHTRLLELIESADSLETIIVLEERLSEIETELDSYQIEIKNYDNLVDYSTISIDIEETEYISPEEDDSVWSQIKKGLSDNLHDIKEDCETFFIWLIVSIPNFIIFAIYVIIIIVIIKLIRRKIKKNKNKKELKMNKQTEYNTEYIEIKENIEKKDKTEKKDK